MTDLLPPHFIEAEQYVLGGLMLDNGALPKVLDGLAEDDFYRGDHRRIFGAIRALAKAGNPCDAVTIADWLDKRDELDSVGGIAYLGSLAANTPSASNIKHYANIVRERAELRRLIETANEIADKAATTPISELREHLLKAVNVAPKPQRTRDLSWTRKFTITKEEADEMAEPDFVFDNFIISGHVILIVAEPNGGKTTILMWVAGRIAAEFRVIYVNADVSGGDAKRMVSEAEAMGFDLLLPDMKAGLSMSDVVLELERMNRDEADLSGMVFIFDTLKKMTDVINKSKAKDLLRTLRGLSAKGATIVCLAHTNKYGDADGNPVYEGTGDLRADVDELIYLIPVKNADGSMTVSTKPDKVRGEFRPITFCISPDREVSLSEFVDVAEIKQADSQRQKDETVIDAVIDAIKAGSNKQTEIVQRCKEYGIGWRTVDRVLNRYRQPPIRLWVREKQFQNNAWNYYLLAGDHSPISSGKSEKWCKR